MRMVMWPPTRGSMETEARGISKPAGPNHRARWSGLVQAWNTSSRGAPKTRVMVISRSSACTTVDSAIFRSSLKVLQVLVQPVEPALPDLAARLHPCRGLAAALGAKPARPRLRRAVARDQPGALEHLQVPRDGWQADRERLRQLGYGRLAPREPCHDRTAGRVGEGGEGEAERFGGHLIVELNNQTVKYTTSVMLSRRGRAGVCGYLVHPPPEHG